MRTVAGFLGLVIAAMAFHTGWANTTAPEYVGPAAWGLILAGLFWLTVAVIAHDVATTARSFLERQRSRSDELETERS